MTNATQKPTVTLVRRGEVTKEAEYFGIKVPCGVETIVMCSEHGESGYIARNDEPIYCPHCRRVEEQREAVAKEVREECQARAHTLRANLPGHQNCDFRGYFRLEAFEVDATTEQGRQGQAKALKVAQRFANRFMDREIARREARKTQDTSKDWRKENSIGLRFLGSVGTGKTHLALAIRDRLHELGLVDACYLPFQRMLDALYRRDGNPTELLNALSKVSCLILDELGAYEHSEADLKRLFQVIDARYLAGRPTVVVTNLETKMLKAAVGERTHERLRETTYPVIFDWESHRKSVHAYGEQDEAEEIF